MRSGVHAGHLALIQAARRIRGPLKFFSIAATVTGIFLLILVARMILQYIVGVEIPHWATYIAQAHGLAYMVYLVSILVLGPRALWPAGKCT